MTARRVDSVRRSIIAGAWYPGTEHSLRRTLEEFVAQVDQPPVPGLVMGLISPHAGYTYSGQTAAYAYRQLRGLALDTVIIMAPSHRVWFDRYAVSAEDAYETPLGRVPLDEEFIAHLAARVPLQRIRGDAEHALEIQLPFLQHELGAFTLVPILISADEPSAALRLGAALADAMRTRPEPGEPAAQPERRRFLVVASSDMHHIENYDEVVRRDRRVVDAIAAYDLEALAPLFMDPRCTVCGRMPILAALHACMLLGADSIRVLHQTNSGDVTGQRRPGQYTVGYMAAAIFKATTTLPF